MALAALFAAACGFGLWLTLRRYGILRRGVLDMLGPETPVGAGPPALVRALTAKWAALEHRSLQSNPVTRLPTREQLLARMAGDLALGRGWVLGLLHFAEFDQLLAFDDAAANAALACLGERVRRAAGARRTVNQVDRATFAIWLEAEGARDAFGAITYVAGQEMPLGDGVLTPTIAVSLIEAAQTEGGAERVLAHAVAGLSAPLGGLPVAAEAACREHARERFVLEQELARAIDQEQLSMVFQPVVDMAAGRVLGAEALLRWNHPELGAVSPARFIPVVERLGLSERYGLWVLNAACREAARWRAEGLLGLRMAVNLSARQVLDPELEAKIRRTLLRHGLDSRALELELTETAAMADADRTLDLFTRLRAQGISLAIDDFGTGYSSLSYLKNLPFTKLKIDREFVTGVDVLGGSRAICKALIELGRGLGLVVLAEGVETAAEVQTLRRLGCSVFQGFHVSKPLVGDAFVRFVRTFPQKDPAAASPRSLSELSA